MSVSGCVQCRRLMLAATLAFLLVLHTFPTTQAASISIRAMEPRRPEQFKNVEELRQYLKELHEYYSVVGRPRFGRSVEIPFLEDALLAEASERLPYHQFLSPSHIPYKRAAEEALLNGDLTY